MLTVFSVKHMQYLNIPKFQTLRGEAAIEALNEYIAELEEQTPGELTDKQAKALTKFARGLISSIESETPNESVQPNHFVSFKKVRDVVLPRLQLFK